MDKLTAKYYIETKKDLREVAQSLATIEATGKWSGPGAQTELFGRCTGGVDEITELRPGAGYVTLSLPMENFNMEESAFSSLWVYMVGGATHAMIDYEKSRLVDFDLPPSYNKYFIGPMWGVKGTKEYLGVPEGEPVIGTIVKPTSGLTAGEVAVMCGEFAAGGLQFIKDDEKMMSPPYCPLNERVSLVMDAVKAAEQKTGRRVLYTPHITTGPENILKFGETAVKAGARGLMVNIFAAGFHALTMLRKEFGLPVYAHCGGKEALGRAEGQGVSPEVVVKLARMMGGEFFRSNILGGYLVGGKTEEIRALNHAMRAPMEGIKDMVPALSGGLNPGNLPDNLRAFGADIMVLAGTGITQHPGGIAEGVAAMRAAARGAL